MLNKYNFQIAELAPTDEERIILAGVFVTPTGTSVTDGRMAMTVSSVEAKQANLFAGIEGVEVAEVFTPFVLDRESALRVAKFIPVKTENQEAEYAVVDARSEDNECAMISVNDVLRQEVMKARKIEGTFPDLTKAMLDINKASVTISFSPDLLVDTLKTIQKFCKGRDAVTITMRVFKTGDAVRFDVDGAGQTLSAVVMPQRLDESKPNGKAKA